MEFGILGAEPSGSFHEEEVVGHRGSEEADRRGGGQFKGTVRLLSPSFCPCPGTRGFGKKKAPECYMLWPVPGDSASHRLRGLAPSRVALLLYFS